MTEPVSLVIATLPGAVRRGCNSPEALANAVYLGVNTSRVAAHNEFISVRAHLQDGAVDEPFEATIDRVVKAHLMAGLGDLTKDYDDDDDDDVGVEGEGPERYLEEHECGLCNGTGNGSGINPYSGEPMRCHGCEGEGKIRYWVSLARHRCLPRKPMLFYSSDEHEVRGHGQVALGPFNAECH
jgi:hypothetical protein